MAVRFGRINNTINDISAGKEVNDEFDKLIKILGDEYIYYKNFLVDNRSTFTSDRMARNVGVRLACKKGNKLDPKYKEDSFLLSCNSTGEFSSNGECISDSCNVENSEIVDGINISGTSCWVDINDPNNRNCPDSIPEGKIYEIFSCKTGYELDTANNETAKLTCSNGGLKISNNDKEKINICKIRLYAIAIDATDIDYNNLPTSDSERLAIGILTSELVEPESKISCESIVGDKKICKNSNGNYTNLNCKNDNAIAIKCVVLNTLGEETIVSTVLKEDDTESIKESRINIEPLRIKDRCITYDLRQNNISRYDIFRKSDILTVSLLNNDMTLLEKNKYYVKVGESVEFKCNKDYYKTGTFTAKCEYRKDNINDDNGWVEDINTCKGENCKINEINSSDKNYEFTVETANSGSNEILTTAYIEGICKDTFYAEERPILRCKNGNWDYESYNNGCIKICKLSDLQKQITNGVFKNSYTEIYNYNKAKTIGKVFTGTREQPLNSEAEQIGDRFFVNEAKVFVNCTGLNNKKSKEKIYTKNDNDSFFFKNTNNTDGSGWDVNYYCDKGTWRQNGRCYSCTGIKWDNEVDNGDNPNIKNQDRVESWTLRVSDLSGPANNKKANEILSYHNEIWDANCAKGFSKEDNKEVYATCNNNKWVHTTAKCRKKCGKPSRVNIEDWSKVSNEYVHNETVTASCSSGYYNDNNGKVSAICKDGEWQHTGSNCVKVCNKNDLISKKSLLTASKLDSNPRTNGTIYNSIYFTNNAKIDAICNNGYTEADGDSNWKHYYYCDNGTWKNVGWCAQNCDSKQQPSNGKWVLTSNNNDLTESNSIHNAERKLVCNSGYTLADGELTDKCNNGTWKPVKTGGWCAQNCTGAKVDNVTFVTADAIHGKQASGLCNEGYYNNNSGKVSATCNNGRWKDAGSCERVCDRTKLTLAANSKYYYVNNDFSTNGTTYDNKRYFVNGAMVDATCNDGYTEVDYDDDDISSEWGKHAYKCVSGTWKRMGSCYQNCSNPSRTNATFRATSANHDGQVTARCNRGWNSGNNDTGITVTCYNGVWSYSGSCTNGCSGRNFSASVSFKNNCGSTYSGSCYCYIGDKNHNGYGCCGCNSCVDVSNAFCGDQRIKQETKATCNNGEWSQNVYTRDNYGDSGCADKHKNDNNPWNINC